MTNKGKEEGGVGGRADVEGLIQMQRQTTGQPISSPGLLDTATFFVLFTCQY